MKAEAVKSYRSFLRHSKGGNRQNIEAIIDSLEKALTEEASAKGAKPTGTLSPGEVTPSTDPVVAPPPPAPEPVAAPVVVETVAVAPPPPPPPKSHRVLWIAVGVVIGVVVVGAAVGAGVGVALSSKTTYPSAAFVGPTIRF